MNTTTHRGLLLMLLLTLAAPAVAGPAKGQPPKGQQAKGQPVKGQFVLNGKAFKPAEIAAFYIASESNPSQFLTLVLLTAKPLDRGAIARSSDPGSTARNDNAMRDADSLTFYVQANGEVDLNATIDGTQYLDSSGMIAREKGSLVATCASNTRDHVACTVKTAKPVKNFGKTWSLDVAFDTSVVPGRAAGK